MTPAGRLREVLLEFPSLAVAVSGGVDSMTLATAAHRALGSRVTMHHATSPAVPGEATERTRALAAQEGWELDVFDAGEFDDQAYRANPVNRCFFTGRWLRERSRRSLREPISTTLVSTAPA